MYRKAFKSSNYFTVCLYYNNTKSSTKIMHALLQGIRIPSPPSSAILPQIAHSPMPQGCGDVGNKQIRPILPLSVRECLCGLLSEVPLVGRPSWKPVRPTALVSICFKSCSLQVNEVVDIATVLISGHRQWLGIMWSKFCHFTETVLYIQHPLTRQKGVKHQTTTVV